MKVYHYSNSVLSKNNFKMICKESFKIVALKFREVNGKELNVINLLMKSEHFSLETRASKQPLRGSHFTC